MKVGFPLIAVASMMAVAATVPSGPPVGSVAPAFEALDQHGAKQTLKTLSGPKGTLLVFFRSADW